MSELEDQINRILGDPAQMAQISALAQSLMGGESSTEAPSDPSPGSGPDGAMLARLGSLMQKAGSGGGRQQALLSAMKPYLSQKRQAKMDRAMKLAQMAKLAQIAMADMGGSEDV